MNIVLAPHIDDELIGVYSILSNIDEVYYFYDITDERKQEAINTSKKFNFICRFNEKISLTALDTVYVTSSFDLHKDHKELNRTAKKLQKEIGFKLKFYSIDMNRKPKVLSNFSDKKDDMYELFPSQKGLFDSDEKYFLFEDIFDKDFIQSEVFISQCRKYDKEGYIKVTIENTTNWNIYEILNKYSSYFNIEAEYLSDEVFNCILLSAPDNVELTNITIEVKTNKTLQTQYKL